MPYQKVEHVNEKIHAMLHEVEAYYQEFAVLAMASVPMLMGKRKAADIAPEEKEQIGEILKEVYLRGVVGGKTLTMLLDELDRDDLTPDQQALADRMIEIMHKEWEENK